MLYSATASTDKDGKTSSQINEWVVRSIKARRGSKSKFGVPTRFAAEAKQFVNITEKIDSLTWGKVSPKHGDVGWLKSIPEFCRKQFEVSSSLPPGIYTTIRAAVEYGIGSTEEVITWYEAEMRKQTEEFNLKELAREISELKAESKALIRRLAKLTA